MTDVVVSTGGSLSCFMTDRRRISKSCPTSRRIKWVAALSCRPSFVVLTRCVSCSCSGDCRCSTSRHYVPSFRRIWTTIRYRRRSPRRRRGQERRRRCCDRIDRRLLSRRRRGPPTKISRCCCVRCRFTMPRRRRRRRVERRGGCLRWWWSLRGRGVGGRRLSGESSSWRRCGSGSG